MRHARLDRSVHRNALQLALCAWFALAATTPRVHASQEIAPPSTKGLIPHWTAIYDATGRCRYSVPPTWRAEGPRGREIARAPDGSVTVAQSWSAASSWISYKAEIRRTLKPSVVQENTPQRFSFEYSAGWPGVHMLVATPSAAGVCATQIDIRSAAQTAINATIRQIIQGLVPFE